MFSSCIRDLRAWESSWAKKLKEIYDRANLKVLAYFFLVYVWTFLFRRKQFTLKMRNVGFVIERCLVLKFQEQQKKTIRLHVHHA